MNLTSDNISAKNGILEFSSSAISRLEEEPEMILKALLIAVQENLNFDSESAIAIRENAELVAAIPVETISHFLRAIICLPRPSAGFLLLDKLDLLKYILPEVDKLKGVETKEGKGHKDNFAHTLQVLDNLAEKSDNEWLRWSALLHDIGKPATKKFEPGIGWTFKNHNFIGEKMIPRIFRRMRLPAQEMKYVAKMVGMHMRPQAMGDEGVTDKGVRRMMTEAGSPKEIDELMALAEADLTSKNPAKVRRVLEVFRQVRRHIELVREKDAERNWENPINGEMIKTLFGIPDSSILGEMKEVIKKEIRGVEEKENFDYALSLLLKIAPQYGLTPIEGVTPEQLRALTKPRKKDEIKK